MAKLKWLINEGNYYYFGDAPVHATGVSLDKSSTRLTEAGQTEQLTATVTPSGAIEQGVTWSSSDTSIATVSQTGLVTCVSPGNCTITVTTEYGGHTATCSILEPIDYLCFTANTAGSTIKLIRYGSPTQITLETSTDKETWTTYTPSGYKTTPTITLSNIGDKIYIRNTSETDVNFSTSDSYYYFFAMEGSISASGDIGFLLNKNSTTHTTNYCFYSLFNGCTALTSCPKFKFEDVKVGSFQSMFANCSNLNTLPKLSSLSVEAYGYKYMFSRCSKIKVSQYNTGEYQTEYRLPFEGTGTYNSGATDVMFDDTGGTFTGTPTVNVSLYTSNTLV